MLSPTTELRIVLATREELEKRLADAEHQQHLLLTGQSARVLVDQNGERVEFTAINAYRLAAYIQELKRQLGLLTVVGPMGAWFP